MHVGVIGAGFTGLAAAHTLTKAGHQVTVYERESQPGGLAIGFQDPAWAWPLEAHYHHLFTSDTAIQDLARQIGHPIHFTRPITSTYYQGQTYQLDSPLGLMKFTALPVIDRLRTAVGLALMRFNPFWQPFEYFTAEKYIRSVMGGSSWRVLWQPLFTGKFGSYADTISAAWFWSRIYKRSPSLGYPKGGFLSLAKSIESAAKQWGANFAYNITVEKIDSVGGKIIVRSTAGQVTKFDKVISSLPTALFSNLSGLHCPKLAGLGAVNLVLALKHDLLPGQAYWLNINDRTFPFLAVVEHTHYQDPVHYGGDHLVYFGNYLPPDHQHFFSFETDLVKEFA